MTITQESRPGGQTEAARDTRSTRSQDTRPGSPTAIPTLNLPLRVDTAQMDALELYTVAALFAVSTDQAQALITTLRGTDFRSPVLEHITRAVQRTARAGQPITPATVTETAAGTGLIRPSQRVELERACHDIIDAGMGAVGLFEAPLVIYAGTLRAVSALSIRCEQIAQSFQVGRPAESIAAAPGLATALRGIAADASSLADRLDEEVAPR